MNCPDLGQRISQNGPRSARSVGRLRFGTPQPSCIEGGLSKWGQINVLCLIDASI